MIISRQFQTKAALEKTRGALAASSQEEVRALSQKLVDSGAGNGAVLAAIEPMMTETAGELAELDGLILRKTPAGQLRLQLDSSECEIEKYRLASELRRRSKATSVLLQRSYLALLVGVIIVFFFIVVLASSNK